MVATRVVESSIQHVDVSRGLLRDFFTEVKQAADQDAKATGENDLDKSFKDIFQIIKGAPERWPEIIWKTELSMPKVFRSSVVCEGTVRFELSGSNGIRKLTIVGTPGIPTVNLVEPAPKH